MEPRDWTPKTIRECLQEEFPGEWGTNPASGAANAIVLRSTDIDDEGHVDLATGAPRVIPLAKLVAKRLRQGDLLLETSGGGPDRPVGRVALFRGDAPGDYLCSNFFRTLRPLQSEVDPSFLRWRLKFLYGRPDIQRFQQQTTGIINLKMQDYFGYVLRLPGPIEQRGIAEVLDTIDRAILATDQLIAKLQQMKQGLLTELLCLGVDGNGDLRNRERHPEEFRDSELGLIPKSWEVKAVESLLAEVTPAMRSGPFGSALLKSELVDYGVPLLGIDNVHVERFESVYSRFVTPTKFRELSRYRVFPKDVMITIMGTVGRCCVVPDGIGDALSSKHVWTLTFDQSRYSPLLACLQFNYAPWCIGHFRRDEQGGIMSAIRSDTLRTALLPVPPRDEAAAIEQVCSASSRNVLDEETLLAKLRFLRSGLAEDLLSGRIRVTSLLEGDAA